ncbi:hypothetical protein [Salipaludibacillus daqingensis]|uniref:hypothetical protein n=1 Tax=Salipaludibacillus daqingensis TaxID=3041001 RepID=UPI0024744BF7|nr:hypothetical protein [Salipaludibacillus daqingensis]
MFGLMLNHKEAEETEYLLKRELEELLLDLSDERIDGLIRSSMEERYQIIFKIYKRFASKTELCKYIRRPKPNEKPIKNKSKKNY